MDKLTNTQHISTSSEAVNAQEYTLCNVSWIPEVLRGEALEALANDIRKNGLRQRILVDENNVIWDGRSRYLACRKVGVTPLFTEISSEDGEKAVRSGLVGRELTVLDEIRLVGRHADELSMSDDKPKGKKSEVLSQHMKDNFGWNRRNSPRHIAYLLKLHKELSKLDDSKLAILRTAATLNEARKGIANPVAKKKTDRVTVVQIRAQLEQIISKEEPSADEMTQMLQGVRDLIETLPAPKAEKAPTPTKVKAPKAKKVKKAA